MLLLLTAAACTDGRPPGNDVFAATCPDPGDGFGAPAWSGPVFLAQQLSAPPAANGQPPSGALDVTGDGVPDGRLNADFQLVSELNYFIAHSGYVVHQFTAFEAAGICSPLPADDPAVTMKYYRVRTCDPSRADNFCFGDGCGELRVNSDDVVGDQAAYRWEPAPLKAGQLVTAVGGDGKLIETELVPGFSVSLTLSRARFAASFTAAADHKFDATLCGAISLRQLAGMQVIDVGGELMVLPASSEVASVAGDLLRRVDGAGVPLQPDVDLDGDGLETYQFDGAGGISCRDEDGQRIDGAHCLVDPAMADGFSVCFEATALRAQLVYATCDAGS